MNNGKQRTALFLLCMICAMATFKPIQTEASAGTVTGYQKITWGISTGRYYVNNIHAFCAQYNKSWPTVGTTIERIDSCTNEVLRKALYYGYNGPANKLGTDDKAHVLTAIAISDANIGERETGASSKYDEFYWDIVNNPGNYPAPPENFKTYMAITSSDDLQNLAFYVLEPEPVVPEEPEEPEEPEIPEKVYQLELTKYQTGTEIPIPGTIFEHVNPDGTTEKVMTDDDGKIFIDNLQKGTHIIRETEVMDGYILNQEEYTFVIDDNSEEITRLTVYNDPAPYDVIVKKVDGYGNLLEGAQFELYADLECQQEVAKGATNENGILKLTGLEIGKKYYMKETKAPAGYETAENIYEIHALSTPAKDEFVFYINGEESGTECYLEIINDVGIVLPKTGSSATLFMVITGMTMCMISMKKELEKRRKYL